MSSFYLALIILGFAEVVSISPIMETRESVAELEDRQLDLENVRRLCRECLNDRPLDIDQDQAYVRGVTAVENVGLP